MRLRLALTRRAPVPQSSRSDSYSFEELAQTLSKKLKPRLCAALLAQARAPAYGRSCCTVALRLTRTPQANDALRTLYAAPAAAADGGAADQEARTPRRARSFRAL